MNPMNPKPEYDVLIVDDQPLWRNRLIKLVGDGINIAQAGSVDEAFHHLQRNFFYCALVDQSLITEREGEDSEGLRVLKEITRLEDVTRCYMITAYGDPDVAFSAGRELKIESYISKAKLVDIVDEVSTKIHDSIQAARLDYAKRYGNGLAQITKTNADAREQTVWEGGVLMAIATPGKAGGGHKELSHLLDHLVKGFPPLIPLLPHQLPQIDKARGVVEAEYWSKPLGQAVRILFGRPGDAEINAEIEKISAKTPNPSVQQYGVLGPYAGIVTATDRPFDNFPRLN